MHSLKVSLPRFMILRLLTLPTNIFIDNYAILHLDCSNQERLIHKENQENVHLISSISESITNN